MNVQVRDSEKRMGLQSSGEGVWQVGSKAKAGDMICRLYTREMVPRNSPNQTQVVGKQ